MKNLLIVLGLLFISISNSHILQAQDPHFSQFFTNKVYLNPAYAGFDPGVNFSLNYRDQWFGVPDGSKGPFDAGYRTYNATVNWQIPCFDRFGNNSFGLALSFFHDEAGAAPLTTTGGSFLAATGLRLVGANSHRTLVAKKLGFTTSSRLKRLDLRAGFQFSLAQRSLEHDYLIYSYQLDPVKGLLNDPTFLKIQSSVYGNINTGILLRGQLKGKRKGKGRNFRKTLFSLGYSLNNITEPNISLLDEANDVILPLRNTFFVSLSIEILRRRGAVGKHGKRHAWYFSPQFRWHQQLNGELNTQNIGFYLFNKTHNGGIFIQYNFSKTSPIDTGAPNLYQSENSTTFIIHYSIDLRNAFDHEKSASGAVLGFTYDIPLHGIGTKSTLGVMEISLRMKLGGNNKTQYNCLRIRQSELYNGECPWDH